MKGPVETAQITLVTIIAEFALQDRLLADLKALGATGYTFASVDGRGRHGRRTRSIADAGNVRIETLVTPVLARAIFEHVVREFSKSSLVAYAHDVDAVPRSRFVS
jgi:nitrogen regulatory protein PII